MSQHALSQVSFCSFFLWLDGDSRKHFTIGRTWRYVVAVRVRNTVVVVVRVRNAVVVVRVRNTAVVVLVRNAVVVVRVRALVGTTSSQGHIFAAATQVRSQTRRQARSKTVMQMH